MIRGVRVLLCMGFAMTPCSSMGMDQSLIVQKMVYGAISKAIVGSSKDNVPLCKEGIACLRKQQVKLKNMTFDAFPLSPVFAQMLLKVLVIHHEVDLLRSFLDMYARSYSQSSDSVNFAYKLEKGYGKRVEIIEYALLDVAFAAYAGEEDRAQELVRQDILHILLDHGCSFKLYGHIKLLHMPLAEREKVSKNKNKSEMPDSQRFPSAMDQVVWQMPSDVGPLLQTEEDVGDKDIALDSGASIRFNFDD